MNRYAIAIAFSAALASSAGLAQNPAQPAATPTANCEKPDEHPGRLASPQRLRGWDREVSAWQECMKKYVSEVQARADAAVKQANAAIAASNAAVAEYNAVAKVIQEQIEATK